MDKDYQLNERQFTFGVIPPVEAIKVEVAIARVIGEPLFAAFMDSKKEGEAGDANQAAAAAVGLLMSKMDADELVATMQIVFKYVTCDGKRVDINSTFVGRNKEVWQVFIAALRFNFADFLPAGLLNSIGAKMPASI